MKKEINLVLIRKESSKEIKKIFLFSVVIFVAVFFFSIAAVLYNLSLNNELDNLQLKEAQLRNEMTALSPKISKVLILQERLVSVDKIIKNRQNLQLKADKILSIVPESLSVEDMSVESQAVSLNLSSDDLSMINSLFEKINSLPQDLSDVKRVNLSSLQQNESGYGLNLDFNYTQ